MSEKLKKQIVLRHSLCWGGAIVLCPIVMVFLDLFDRHTPSNIALLTAVSMMFVFVISNSLLVKGLNEVSGNDSVNSEGDV